MSDNESWGLAAIALNDDVEINIHRQRSTPEAWEFEIRAMDAYFRFRIPGPGIVKKMERFLDQEIDDWGEMEVGSLGSRQVLLVRDRPPNARCWLKVIFEDGCFSVMFADSNAETLLEALRDVARELN